ncbi:unknown [Acetobacter sp. CAG:977]|mgnify:FL=1|nr:unknown [Acetobacter sp. CAG:977]
MLNLLIKAVSHFKFWNIMVIACLATAFVSIEVRSFLKPYLSADIRSILKMVHITAGYLLVISACFHGLGRSGYLVRLNRKRQERNKIA